MPISNLIDKLTTKVDTVRQRAADKFGLPAHNMFRVLRTWSGSEIGVGTATDLETEIAPTPRIQFRGGDRLDPEGLVDQRTMVATQISLSYQEAFLEGQPLGPGQQCFYKLVERNGQGAATTYWILTGVPEVERNKIGWKLSFRTFTVCP